MSAWTFWVSLGAVSSRTWIGALQSDTVHVLQMGREIDRLLIGRGGPILASDWLRVTPVTVTGINSCGGLGHPSLFYLGSLWTAHVGRRDYNFNEKTLSVVFYCQAISAGTEIIMNCTWRQKQLLIEWGRTNKHCLSSSIIRQYWPVLMSEDGQ